MNERIKELAEQAKEETDVLYAKLTPQEFKDTYNQKFAELIIKECMQEIQQQSMNSGDEWEDGLQIAKGAIEEHFGVIK